MGKIWDIIPPGKKPKNHPHRSAARKKSNSPAVFFVLVIIIIVGIFLYSASQNTPINIDGATTSSQQKAPIVQPENSPTQKTRGQLLIKILNGSGRSEEASKVTLVLSGLGFEVLKTENALSLYDQTTVYFEPGQEKYAQEIAQNLNDYQAKTQKFSQESPYDIIVVIGGR